MPFAGKLLPGFQVEGTWNVPTTLTFVGCVLLPARKVPGIERSDHIEAILQLANARKVPGTCLAPSEATQN